MEMHKYDFKDIAQEIKIEIIDKDSVIEKWENGVVKNTLLKMPWIDKLLYSDGLLPSIKKYISNQADYKGNSQKWGLVFLTLENMLLEYDKNASKEREENTDAEEDDDDDDEMGLGKLRSIKVIKEHSFLEALKDIFKNKIMTLSAIAPVIIAMGKIIDAIKYLWAAFIGFLGYLGQLIDSDSLFKVVNIAANKNAIIAGIIAVICTIAEFVIEISSMIMTAIRWYKNPTEELARKIRENTKVKESPDSPSTDDLGVSAEIFENMD